MPCLVYASQHAHFSVDQSVLCLAPPALFQILKPVVTTGDGSCLFHAFSLTLTGTESCSDLIRLLTVHALVKHQNIMFSAFRDAYRDAYRSLTETQTQGRLNQLFNSAITTAVKYNWGTDFLIFALCLLFDRPVFQCNSDLNHTLPLTDSAEQLSQRFLSFEEGTRTHLVYCTSVYAKGGAENWYDW